MQVNLVYVLSLVLFAINYWNLSLRIAVIKNNKKISKYIYCGNTSQKYELVLQNNAREHKQPFMTATVVFIEQCKWTFRHYAKFMDINT